MATLAQELGARVNVEEILAESPGVRLSDDERRLARRLVDEELAQPNCILERDCAIDCGGFTITGTLRAYGKLLPHFPGDREEPEEAAHFDIQSVTLATRGRDEFDICHALGDEALDQINAAAMGDA